MVIQGRALTFQASLMVFRMKKLHLCNTLKKQHLFLVLFLSRPASPHSQDENGSNLKNSDPKEASHHLGKPSHIDPAQPEEQGTCSIRGQPPWPHHSPIEPHATEAIFMALANFCPYYCLDDWFVITML